MAYEPDRRVDGSTTWGTDTTDEADSTNRSTWRESAVRHAPGFFGGGPLGRLRVASRAAVPKKRLSRRVERGVVAARRSIRCIHSIRLCRCFHLLGRPERLRVGTSRASVRHAMASTRTPAWRSISSHSPTRTHSGAAKFWWSAYRADGIIALEPLMRITIEYCTM